MVIVDVGAFRCLVPGAFLFELEGKFVPVVGLELGCGCSIYTTEVKPSHTLPEDRRNHGSAWNVEQSDVHRVELV